MKVKFSLVSRQIRHWAVPLFSVATFIPLWVAYVVSSPSSTPKTQLNPVIPSPSPIFPSLPNPPEETAIPRSIPPQPLSKAIPPRSTPPKTTPKPAHHTPKPLPPVATKPHHKQPLVVPANYAPPALEIRVAIKQDASNVLIGVSGQSIVIDRQGRGLKTLPPSEGLWVSPTRSGLQMGDVSLPETIFVQPMTKDGLVYVDDRWYRGKVLIVSQGDRLLVVNHVNLEEYLYSVVGSEMHPTAPGEALKAQAIAARSYALVHLIRPASPWFNLGNTQRWQVYKGIQSEYNSGHQAVNATAGQILSYKGGVVESLYAATDEIVSWAHGGRGMSQTGAYKLAEQGYDHQQILGNYYPGVSLARLVLQR